MGVTSRGAEIAAWKINSSAQHLTCSRETQIIVKLLSSPSSDTLWLMQFIPQGAFMGTLEDVGLWSSQTSCEGKVPHNCKILQLCIDLLSSCWKPWQNETDTWHSEQHWLQLRSILLSRGISHFHKTMSLKSRGSCCSAVLCPEWWHPELCYCSPWHEHSHFTFIKASAAMGGILPVNPF